ncbi:hypothetical protein H721_01664 [Brucella ovis IntaBari-2006-46-332]|nr:hypothetical protein C010_01656 [Brucella ovis 80/125]ENR07742.1 hypothetical protein C961_01636 [Brucella ovis F8/05B]ENS94167.1 hypothetical protein B999_01978 [Brucella ovis 63/96]ENS98266.1 hypothetical protein C009_01666 [Brucella ovis 81/8]ENT77740.1 hypothetical protein H712_01639 [Brucella ovis IntaBari-2009-88-4]ENT80224.1 hypothetical protein H720_01648 [Brucella ovis IntaBari-2006-46-348]ENT83285.1 hypothetical protein H713_01641 [Brucella ovis IntaBari-2010-47-268]ENT87819.1 h
MSDMRESLVRERLDEGRDYDPYRLSSPRVVILSMLIFLIIVAFLAAILMRQIHTFFVTNPGLNGLILGVLLVSILLAFGQVLRLLPEIRWVNSFRDGDREGTARPPVLLAPMRALIGRRQSMALSTSSMRSILDSIATRLDESRDISRYLIGLLVFLGLLGTFWGLLETVGSISRTIQTLDPNSGSTGDVLDALKAGLQAPLSGMGTAFSSSVFSIFRRAARRTAFIRNWKTGFPPSPISVQTFPAIITAARTKFASSQTGSTTFMATTPQHSEPSQHLPILPKAFRAS